MFRETPQRRISNRMGRMTKQMEQEHRAEAERLAELPRTEQRQLIAQHRAIAADRNVPLPARKQARERAEALERHLRRLKRRKKGE